MWEMMWGWRSTLSLHSAVGSYQGVTPLLPAPNLPLPRPLPRPPPYSCPSPLPRPVPSPAFPFPGPTLQSNKKEVFIRKFENGQLVREDKLGKEDIKVSLVSTCFPIFLP